MCGEVIGGRGKGTGIFGLHTSAHPKMKALSRILGWSFVSQSSDVKRPFIRHLHRPNFRVRGPNQPQPVGTGQEITPYSCKTTRLCEPRKA